MSKFIKLLVNSDSREHEKLCEPKTKIKMPVCFVSFFYPAWKSRHTKMFWISDRLHTAPLWSGSPHPIFARWNCLEQYLIDLCISLTATETSVSHPTSLKFFGGPIFGRNHILNACLESMWPLMPFCKQKQGPYWFVMLRSAFRDFAQSGAFGWLRAEFGAGSAQRSIETSNHQL